MSSHFEWRFDSPDDPDKKPSLEDIVAAHPKCETCRFFDGCAICELENVPTSSSRYCSDHTDFLR